MLESDLGREKTEKEDGRFTRTVSVVEGNSDFCVARSYEIKERGLYHNHYLVLSK